ncbi:MAG: polyprenyl synthetase family protein [Candidatus Sericytochromatia bacterium]|nr:polyprenyl synthetase family protein [Candidatus Tanganyikabacteria bacterium]
MTGAATAGGYLASLPDGMRLLAERVLAKAGGIAADYPEWPLLALPGALADAYGLAAERREALLAGAVLFYAAADVIDDAQDGDLDPADWGEPPWLRAVNVGNALLFTALAAFLDAAPPAGRGAMAAAVARAGLAMTGGQHRDFELGPGGTAYSETEYLACIEGKSGGSLGLFCRAAGLAAGVADAALLDRQETLGRCVGAAVQLRSDMVEIWSTGPSRDLANGRRTLPVLYGLAASDPAGRAALPALLSDAGRKVELIAALDALGTGPYCDLRLAAYAGEALAALDGLGLDPDSREAIARYVETHGQPHWRTAI